MLYSSKFFNIITLLLCEVYILIIIIVTHAVLIIIYSVSKNIYYFFLYFEDTYMGPMNKEVLAPMSFMAETIMA